MDVSQFGLFDLSAGWTDRIQDGRDAVRAGSQPLARRAYRWLRRLVRGSRITQQGAA